MSVESKIVDMNETLEITITGALDKSQIKDFRAIYEEHGTVFSTYIVNLKDVEYIDSLALGELLYFKKYASDANARIILSNVNKVIKDMLQVSACSKLFEFS